MSSAPVLLKIIPFSVRIESGPQVGQKFNFSKPRVLIGRGPENDLVLVDDLKMSRQHAEISIENGVLCLRNLSQKNSLWVDGKEQQFVVLDRAISVLIGDTLIHFIPPATSLSARQPTNLRVLPAGPVATPVDRSTKASKRPAAPPVARSSPGNNSSRVVFYAILAAVVIGLAWLLSGDGRKAKNVIRPITLAQTITENSKLEEMIKKSEEGPEAAHRQTLQYKMAQEYYLKGARDYRLGQFARAQTSFEAALSFDPSHELAKKYSLASKQKVDGIIQSNLLQGERYEGRNNFRLCKSAMSKVMIMIKDTSDERYQKAKSFYNNCTKKMEEKY